MNKNHLAALLLATAPFVTLAQPLLSAQELQRELSNPLVQIIDIRDPQAYEQGHLPGAVSAPYTRWRGPDANPGELPEISVLSALVQNIGLTAESHAVVVSHGNTSTDFGAAARVYWTLRLLGLTDLSILNGGVQAWQKAALPLDTQTVTVTPSTFEPSLNSTVTISRDEIANKALTGSQTRLIDARPSAFFEGQASHPSAKVAGTLEGAENVSHALWFTPSSGELAALDSIRQTANDHNLAQPDQEIVSFCNTGHWAATNWFVLSELLEQPDVKLYAGSMVDWTQAREALPVKNAPGRVEKLWQQAQQWFANL